MILISQLNQVPDQFCWMVFSKTFGYAIRSILYVAAQKDRKGKVQLDEIAEALNIPRYFLGKIMNKLVKEGILDSVKGHHGGFSINQRTLTTKLAFITGVTGDSVHSGHCVLHLGSCNATDPCPIHHQAESLKRHWDELLMNISVEDLVLQNRKSYP